MRQLRTTMSIRWKNIFFIPLGCFPSAFCKALYYVRLIHCRHFEVILKQTDWFDFSLSRQVVHFPCGRYGCCMDSGEDMDVSFVMPLYWQLLTVLLELHLPSLPLPVRSDCATGHCAVGEQMLEGWGSAVSLVHMQSVSLC